MTEGIIARFRTMAIHRGSVLVGHVAGSVLQSVLSVVLVGAVGVAIGFPFTIVPAREPKSSMTMPDGRIYRNAFGLDPFVRISYATSTEMLEQACRRIIGACEALEG